MADPIVWISSYPPHPGPLARFCAEAREFLARQSPDHPVVVISHKDGRGEDVLPLIDPDRPDWWGPVAAKLEELRPYAVHVQHDRDLYRPAGDGVGGGLTDEERIPPDPVIDLIEAIRHWPVVVEPHTIYGRMNPREAAFISRLCGCADVVLFKCHYQRWRLEWTFPKLNLPVPTNVMIVPHGARPDRRYGVHEVPELRRQLGLDRIPQLAHHLVGLIGGWIHSNRRWEILTSMWEQLAGEIHQRTGQRWDLLAAGARSTGNGDLNYERYRSDILRLEQKGIAHYWEYTPGGDDYDRMMAVCDFVVLPGTDEAHASTLARIIALNKPFITAAPLEGLTVQTLESGGGLLFASKAMLHEAVLRLACDEALRLRMGGELKRYLDEVVSWEVVTRQYLHAYDLARHAKRSGQPVQVPREY